MRQYQNNGKWTARIAAALKALGGEASLPNLYAEIQKQFEDQALANNWQSSVRQTLQSNSAEWPYLGNKTPLFRHKARSTLRHVDQFKHLVMHVHILSFVIARNEAIQRPRKVRLDCFAAARNDTGETENAKRYGEANHPSPDFLLPASRFTWLRSGGPHAKARGDGRRMPPPSRPAFARSASYGGFESAEARSA